MSELSGEFIPLIPYEFSDEQSETIKGVFLAWWEAHPAKDEPLLLSMPSPVTPSNILKAAEDSEDLTNILKAFTYGTEDTAEQRVARIVQELEDEIAEFLTSSSGA